MTKKQFLKELEKQFSSVSPEEKRKMLEYYSEIIDDKIDDGKTEAQAVSELNSPLKILEDYLGETTNTHTKPTEKKRSAIGIIGFSLLIPFVLLFIVTLGIIALSFIFSSAAIAVSGIVTFVSSFVLFGQDFLIGLFQLGAGLFLVAAGFFALWGSAVLCKLCLKLFKKIIKKYVSVYGGI